MSAFIDERQNSKYQRDNISNINQHRQNRRFRRSKRRNHNRERKTIHKANEKLVIEQAKAFCPYQNAINEKSFLRKGLSFVPNQNVILIILSTSFAKRQLKKMMKIKKCKYIRSRKSTSNSEASTYKLPKGKDKHK